MKPNIEKLLEMFKGADPNNKSESIQLIIDNLGISYETARTYFYQWKSILKKQNTTDLDARVKEYVAEKTKQDDTLCDPHNAPKWLREKNVRSRPCENARGRDFKC